MHDGFFSSATGKSVGGGGEGWEGRRGKGKPFLGG